MGSAMDRECLSARTTRRESSDNCSVGGISLNLWTYVLYPTQYFYKQDLSTSEREVIYMF